MLKKLFLISLLVVVAAMVLPAWYLLDLPDIDKLQTENPSSTAIRTFREDRLRQKGKKPHSSMQWRNLNEISPHLQHAVVLAEDDTFFQHKGFDIEMLKHAAKTNWERRRFAFGASTITQQLARTLYLSSHKNLLRKAKEALITRRIERALTKERILELYLNVVEWGPQVYGAEAASRLFFQKSAFELTPEEAISLAVILPSPRRWNPHKQSWFMAQRKAALYDRMVRAKYIEPPVVDEEGWTSEEMEMGSKVDFGELSIPPDLETGAPLPVEEQPSP